MNKTETISFSNIKLFRECRRAFYFYKVDKKALPNDAMNDGTDQHAFIAEAIKNNTFETVEADWLGPRARFFIKKILVPGVFPGNYETKFEIDLMVNKVIGFIDYYAIQGKTAVIVDWKRNPGFSEELQLKIYAAAVKQLHPEVEIFECYFYYFGSDGYDKEIYSASQVDDFVSDLYNIATDISSEWEKYDGEMAAFQKVALSTPKDQTIAPFVPVCFPTRVSQKCEKCDYVAKCPEAQKFEIQPMKTKEQVREMAKRCYVAEGLIKAFKDGLKDFLLENGLDELPIDDDNRYYLTFSATLKSGKIEKPKEPKEKKTKMKKEKTEDAKS